MAALALRNAGSTALPCLNALVAALKDADASVRMMSAHAISRQGKNALPALSALIEAGQVEGEQAQVLRNLAGALGAIGPEAATALPILQKLQVHPEYVGPLKPQSVRSQENCDPWSLGHDTLRTTTRMAALSIPIRKA